MPPRAPDFWRRRGAASLLLAPLGFLYGAAGAARFALARPYRAKVPVICVGNLNAGGSGKTPVVMSIAKILAARGVAVHVLSRGYGGKAAGPLRIDSAKHTAADVGDEPLMLARIAPSWVARDRAAAARAIESSGAGAILMDDGLQNPGLAKDLSLITIDSGYGFGNGRVMPAGPLREPLARGLARADAVVMLGADQIGAGKRLGGKPVLEAEPSPSFDGLGGRVVFAFAGIARPQKFFDHFAKAGVTLAGARDFPDHHLYDEAELKGLAAAAKDAALVTTEKDWVRLAPSWRTRIRYLPLAIEWRDRAALERLLDRALGQHRG
jgi:tetraacyldisaccharide 4'-kinase